MAFTNSFEQYQKAITSNLDKYRYMRLLCFERTHCVLCNKRTGAGLVVVGGESCVIGPKFEPEL